MAAYLLWEGLFFQNASKCSRTEISNLKWLLDLTSAVFSSRGALAVGTFLCHRGKKQQLGPGTSMSEPIWHIPARSLKGLPTKMLSKGSGVRGAEYFDSNLATALMLNFRPVEILVR